MSAEQPTTRLQRIAPNYNYELEEAKGKLNSETMNSPKGDLSLYNWKPMNWSAAQMKLARSTLPVLVLLREMLFWSLQICAQDWSPTSAPVAGWQAIASSADGARLVAATWGGSVYTSTNSGSTWNGAGLSNADWSSVASSADGSKLVAANWGGRVYVSTNSGADWEAASLPVAPWNSVATSADGVKLVAVAYDGLSGNLSGMIYSSTNSGTDWTSSPSGPVLSVVCSGDGRTMVTAGCGNYTASRISMIHLSTNFGATWLMTNAPTGGAISIARSTDCSRLLLAASCQLYTSTNLGASWTLLLANGPCWSSAASSSDGTRLIAAASHSYLDGNYTGGPIFRSTNSGTTWVPADAPTTNWTAVSSSADGGRFVAGVGGASGSGLIYTSQSAQSPTLSLARFGNNLVISWIVPSVNFVLQENSDMSTANWTGVATSPALNFTNLQYEVTVAGTNASRFYRLKGSQD